MILTEATHRPSAYFPVGFSPTGLVPFSIDPCRIFNINAPLSLFLVEDARFPMHRARRFRRQSGSECSKGDDEKAGNNLQPKAHCFIAIPLNPSSAPIAIGNSQRGVICEPNRLFPALAE